MCPRRPISPPSRTRTLTYPMPACWHVSRRLSMILASTTPARKPRIPGLKVLPGLRGLPRVCAGGSGTFAQPQQVLDKARSGGMAGSAVVRGCANHRRHRLRLFLSPTVFRGPLAGAGRETFLDDFQKHWPTDAEHTHVDLIATAHGAREACAISTAPRPRQVQPGSKSALPERRTDNPMKRYANAKKVLPRDLFEKVQTPQRHALGAGAKAMGVGGNFS